MQPVQVEKARLLVVDDDGDLRSLLADRLRVSGYDVIEAEDGTTAIDCARENSIAVVLLDVMMPGMDGFEVLERIQTLENRPSVILLSAMSDADSRLRGLDGGAIDYVSKPYEHSELLARVAVAVRQHGVQIRAPN